MGCKELQTLHERGTAGHSGDGEAAIIRDQVLVRADRLQTILREQIDIRLFCASTSVPAAAQAASADHRAHDALPQVGSIRTWLTIKARRFHHKDS